MSETPFLSICIPSYNRIFELQRLLESIDCDTSEIEIVICEDNSPNRCQIRDVVEKYASSSAYSIHYHENADNLGFDGNLRHLVEYARGDFVMFMGDDDLFVPKTLSRFVSFLKNNSDKLYVLRSYIVTHQNGQIEKFLYLPNTTVLSEGEETTAWLFKRSVTICGFTISRLQALEYATSDLDGTLLYQVYLMSQVCLRHKSIYFDLPFVQAVQTFREDKPMFGSSNAEKSRYSPGKVSADNSINFTKAYFEVTEYLDKKNQTNLTHLVRKDISKYSYPFLSIQRKRGIASFLRYAKRLDNEVGLGSTTYFHIYKWALVIFGERICDRFIAMIKRTVGYTPNF
jgi:glycosyltransferase involved in cell wall biosynthesis